MKLSKTILAVVATGLLSCGLFSQQVQANSVTMNYGSRHSGNGGEFNASSPNFVPATMGYKAKTTYNGGVETFCLETNEFFNPGSTYNYGISQGAIHGGVSGGDPDLISRGTAWLYLKFANGTLAGYNYSIGALVTPAREPCSRRFGGWKVKALILTMLLAHLSRSCLELHGRQQRLLRCGRSQSVGRQR